MVHMYDVIDTYIYIICVTDIIYIRVTTIRNYICRRLRKIEICKFYFNFALITLRKYNNIICYT